MNHHSRTILRCSGLAILVVGVLALLPSAAQAQAHTTGLAVSKDCPTDPVAQGQCAVCTFTIRNLDTAHSVNNLTVQNEFTFGSGNINVGTCLQGGNPVTVLGPGGSATDSCGGSFTECAPISCSDQPELMIDEVRGAGTDAGPAPFTGLPATGSTQNAIQVSELICGAPPECNTVACVPGPSPCNSPEACDGPGVGCVVSPAQDSTPCGTDTDGNDCTAPGCLAGVCAQTHILDPVSTACGTDSTPTDCTAPGCTATGVCSQTHNLVPVSTTCGTDTDGNDCTAPGCDGAGTCVQTHTLVPESDPCGTDTDPTDCTTPGCTATGECSQTHTLVPFSTPCGTDTDGLTCTIPGCTATGICNQTHIADCGEEICRTPGFWGTHGGVEKASSTNITLALLNAYNAANDPDLTICGTPITNTTECSQNSALEAICVSPKGDSLLQLGRQLTAAALNCIITNSTEPNGEICPSAGLTGGVCSGVSIEGIFSACNAACEAGNTTALVDLDNDPGTDPVEVSCIGAIDCFNNGGAINETTGECDGSTECHDRDLVQGCFNFEPPGAAGSPRECNDSRKNCVTIFGNLSDCTDTCP